MQMPDLGGNYQASENWGCFILVLLFVTVSGSEQHPAGAVLSRSTSHHFNAAQVKPAGPYIPAADVASFEVFVQGMEG